MIVGLAGILLAPIFRLLMREPERGRYDSKGATTEKARFADFATLFAKPSFWLISFGAASSSIMGYGVFFWAPSFLIRSYGMSLPEVSVFFSSLVLIGGIVGIWLGGALGDWLGARSRAWFALVPAIAFVLTVPCYVFALLSPSKTTAFIALLPPTALGLVWLGPAIASIQHLAAPNMRTSASALFLFINNLIGLGAGTLIIGALSDALTSRYGDEALRYSILAGTGFFVIAAILFGAAALFLKRDWEE
jgi:sugar phosphate permease